MRPAPNYHVLDANGRPLLLLDRLKLVVQVGKCGVSADFLFMNVYQSPLFWVPISPAAMFGGSCVSTST